MEELTLEMAKSSAYGISLSIVWVITNLSFWIVSLILKSKNTNWGRFYTVLSMSAVISGMVFLFVYSSPNTIIKLFEGVKSLFGY